MSLLLRRHLFIICGICAVYVYSFAVQSSLSPLLSSSSSRPGPPPFIHPCLRGRRLCSLYSDMTSFEASTSGSKILVGFTTDAWNIGMRKYKEFLAVHKMTWKIHKQDVRCVELPMWEINQGPHYDALQRLFESFWIPDMTSTEQLLLQVDLVIIPDPTLAKYLVESYFEKEVKVEKKKSYYANLLKQPWGVLDAFPPKERYEYERIKNLDKQKWIRKFPPLATCGDDAYQRLKNHGQIEFSSLGVEDFALYLPPSLIPSKRVLLLRYKNRFEALAQSLEMNGISVTSAYPVTWMKKEWSPQEERQAEDVDVVYFHENHAVSEWIARMAGKDNKKAIAACHDENVAKVAKAGGFEDIFYAKKSDTNGLTKTVMEAIEHAKSVNRTNRK